MKEPRSNVGFVHTGCAAARRKKWQEENKNLALKPGDFVKLSFFDHADGPVEHMWVEVTKITDEKFKIYEGVLNNDPFVVTSWQSGDALSFTFDEIEDHLPPYIQHGEG